MTRITNRATVTAKGQTTIPIAVRKALDVMPEDKLEFTILEGGRVEVKKARDEGSDPIVERYLEFLEQDLMKNPQKLSVLERDTVLTKLLSKVEIEAFELD